MTASVRVEEDSAATPCFRAVAGGRQFVGKTAGEALDALLASESEMIDSSAILIQRFVGDRYFSDEKHRRLQELLARRESLTTDESDELETLIDTELEATTRRAKALIAPHAA